MAKIRGLKPEFWTDEDIVELSAHARLLYIGMWNFACDNGHLADKPKQIKMRVLPSDDVNVSELLRELAASGRILRDAGWITVPHLRMHQKVDVRYFTSCDFEGCDDPPEKVSQRNSRRVHAVQPSGTQGAPDVSTPSARADGDGDGDGDGELMVMVKGKKPSPRKRAPEIPLPEDWKPKARHAKYAADHGLTLPSEVMKFRNHCLANDRRQRQWDAAFDNWLLKGLDFRPKAAPTDSYWALADRPRA